MADFASGPIGSFREPERRVPARLDENQIARAEQEPGAPIPVHGSEARPELDVEAPHGGREESAIGHRQEIVSCVRTFYR
jgi:hypothetical protein